MTLSRPDRPSASFDRSHTTAIELDNVTFGYDRTRQVLSGIKMSVPRGQVAELCARFPVYGK